MSRQKNCSCLRNNISRAHAKNLPRAPQNLPLAQYIFSLTFSIEEQHVRIKIHLLFLICMLLKLRQKVYSDPRAGLRELCTQVKENQCAL